MSSRSRSIYSACRRGNEEYVDEFIAQHAEEQRQQEQQLVAAHVANSSRNKRGATAASTAGKSAAAAAFSDSSLSLPSSLSGYTPLHIATIFQQRGCVKRLLDAGVSASEVDVESGWGPLFHALYRGDFLTAHLLLQSGSASLTAQDATQSTAVDLISHHLSACSRRSRTLNGSGRVSSSAGAVRLGSLNPNQTTFQALQSAAATNDSNPPHNLLYSFGYQSNYTLGYSCDHYQHRARLIDSLAPHSVKQVLALRQAVFILDKDGFVYSQGQGQSGKLGHEAKETLIEPRRISSLHSITHISGTDDFVACVNAKGHVFVFGYSAFSDAQGAGANGGNSSANSGAGGKARFQTGSNSPPLGSRSLDSSSSSAASSSSSSFSSVPPIRYSQLPRRVDALRSLNVVQVFPCSSRLLLLTAQGDLWFLGQAIEDSDRWELAAPKKFAAPIQEEIVQVANKEEFVAVLTTAGCIRIQRRGERKLNKIWLQNYTEDEFAGASSSASSSSASAAFAREGKTIRDLFPLIPPSAHVVRMSWTSDGKRGAAVTRGGQLFIWKLPAAETKNAQQAQAAGAGGSSPPLKSTNNSNLLTNIPALVLFPSSSSPPIASSMDKQMRAASAATTAPSSSSSSASVSYPRCIGYLVEGLAHVRVTDACIATGHCTALTEEGWVFTFGPGCLGHVHPSEAATAAVGGSAATAAAAQILHPRRLLHLAQVVQVHASEQYMLVVVGINQPAVLPSFPELHGLYNEPSSRHTKPAPVQVPSLRLLCQHHLAQQITPQSVLAAFQWAFATNSAHLLHYCSEYLLENLPFYLPAALSVPDVSCLQFLQQQYHRRFPLWFYSPAWTQPLQQMYAEEDAAAGMESKPFLDPTRAVSASATAAEEDSESFSFSNALAALKVAAQKAAQPKTVEERVGEIKTKRRALVKKLAQIDTLELKQNKQKLSAEEREKVGGKEQVQRSVQDLDGELLTLRDQGSISAQKLWDRLHNVEDPEEEALIVAAAAAEEEKRKKEEEAKKEEAKLRVAAELVDRPVRSLNQGKAAAKEEEKKAPTASKKNSAAAAAPIAAPVTVAPVARPAAAAPTWKSPALSPQVSSSSAAVSLPPSSSSPALPTPSTGATSSFAAIQAEEARLAAALAAEKSRQAKASAAGRTGAASSSSSSSGGIVPAGSKGWGATAAAIVSPALKPASSSASINSNFPSLGAAASATSPLVKPSQPSTAAGFRPASASLASSISSPSLRPSTAASANAAPSAPVGFSLADFMPSLLPKAKPAQPQLVKNSWNTATVVVPPPPAALMAQQAAAAAAAVVISSTPQKKKGKQNGQASSTVAASPSLPPTPAIAAPVSLLSIQAQEEEMFYGSGGRAFKTRREMEEMELSASGQKSAWSSMHVASAAVVASSSLVELQAQQLAAEKAAAKAKVDEEERIKMRAEKAAKKKEKRAAAATKEAQQPQAPSASIPPSKPPTGAPAPAGAASEAQKAGPDAHGGARGGGRGGRGGRGGGRGGKADTSDGSQPESTPAAGRGGKEKRGGGNNARGGGQSARGAGEGGRGGSQTGERGGRGRGGGGRGGGRGGRGGSEAAKGAHAASAPSPAEPSLPPQPSAPALNRKAPEFKPSN